MEAVKKYGSTSWEASLALERLEQAKKEFQSTPEGIKQLVEECEIKPNDESVVRELWIAETTRKLQTNALKEVNNHRVKNFATLIVGLKGFYDDAEAESLIESVREHKEKTILSGEISDIDFSTANENWKTFLANIENDLTLKYNGELPDNVSEALSNLKVMNTPDNVSFGVYKNSLEAFQISRKQLASEIKTIAALQGVSPKIAAEYYEAYRNQYKTNFTSKPESERPDPPTSWLRGDFGFSGYANDPNTKFAPHDSASLYAVYRLRSDDKAIPDYVKQSRGYASISLQNPSTIDIRLYNSNGKIVGRVQKNLTQSAGLTSEIKSFIPEIADAVDGKILLSMNQQHDSNWLQKIIPEYNVDTPLLTPGDLARKHFDLPNQKLKTICDSVGIKYPLDSEAHNAELVADAFFQMRKHIQKQWQQKPSRKLALPLSYLPANSRWSKKPI